MKSIEEKLWEYIDGTCTVEEQQAIDLLIQTDADFKQKYRELLKLNREFAAMELDEPSMAFTYNVMEAIRNEEAKQPLKARINPYIIRGLAAFFIMAILGTVITLFTGTLVNSTSVTIIQLPDVEKYFTKPVLNAFLFFDTILALFLLDAFLHKRSFAKSGRS